MKKRILTFVTILFIVNYANSQAPENSIKKIAGDYLINIQELFDVNIYDQNDHLMMVYDYINKVDILDPNITVSASDTLSYYKIQSLNPHGDMHFMFTKNSKWVIISMAGTLPGRMPEGVELCEKLNLDFHESLYVFKEILKFKEMYYKDDYDDVIIE